jgi:quinol monooxygenase YgiN
MPQSAMIIKTRTKPGKREVVSRLYQELLAPRAAANAEQLLVVWCDDAHDPDVFYLFEIYANQEAMGSNAQAPWFAEYMQQAGPLLAAEPEVAMAIPGWAKGL